VSPEPRQETSISCILTNYENGPLVKSWAKARLGFFFQGRASWRLTPH